MKKLSNYIIEKYKISSNSIKIKVNDKFTLDLTEEYYTISFSNRFDKFDKHRIIHEDIKQVVYIYSKDELVEMYKKEEIPNFSIIKFPDIYKEKIYDVMDNIIPLSKYRDLDNDTWINKLV